SGDSHGAIDECERFSRSIAAMNLNAVAHFPVAAFRNERVLPGWKIDNFLWRNSGPRNLAVLAAQSKLRAGWIGFNIQRAFVTCQTKNGRLKGFPVAKIDNRLDRIVARTHH